MSLPINRFDGFDLGEFDETDKQQDTYSVSSIPRWYGWISERKNDRTEFVVERSIDFSTLRAGIYSRLDSIMIGEEFVKRPATLGETEVRAILRSDERNDTNRSMRGDLPLEVGGGSAQLFSSVNEIAVVTVIDRYAYKAPPEVKLQAGVEFAVWQIRQPIGSNHANALVRSGAATYLDPYKYRSL